ncbi:MAG: C40 family peptidase [Parcubacteria group bacterium]|nr:C40 family peptidase [Parcubacteria group bacterium]
MKASYRWLQSYFEKELPSPEMVADTLTFHAFEVEHVEKIGDDTIFDIDILPNRTHDCLSHLGVARELSVLLNMPLKQDVMREKEKQLPLSRTLSVSVENPLMCRRYMAGVIRGARIAPSPQWLQERLLSIGQKSINNVVDATNYVMFSLGQPLHAFDARKLAEENGMHIIVRSAKKGETITLLSGEEHTLSPDHLLIADGHSGLPLGIAGVKGGVTADIDEKTEDIIIESANFNPTSIRKTSRHFEIRTDASIRFENELAPELAYYGITEAVNLILEIAGGDVEGYVDAYPKRMTMQYKVGMSLSEVNQLLGASITAKEIEKTLTSLGYVYEKVSPIEKVLSLAPSLKGIPYTPIGAIRYDNGKQFSCSSFTNYLFVEGGVALPSVSIDQYAYGMPVGASDIQPGDLIFFNSKTGAVRYETVGYMKGTAVPEGVDHCALYIGEENMIHAAREQGMVVEEKISDSKQYKDIIGYRRMTDNKKRYVVKIPFERLDVRVKEDLIEEIGRIYGYQNIPALIPEQNSIQPDINKSFYYAEKIRRFLTDRGFTEVYTYSMRNFGQIEIENPLAGDKSFLRDGLHYGVEEGI